VSQSTRSSRAALAILAGGAVLLIASCSHGSQSASAGSGTADQSQGSFGSLRVLSAYRTGCRSDGTSAGLALDVEIVGYSGQLLSAGAATAADPDPLVATSVRPSNNDWRHRIIFTPLAETQDRLAAGTVRIRFGVSVVKTGTALLSQPLSVVVPSASAEACVKN
jgi:hypothetical protein